MARPHGGRGGDLALVAAVGPGWVFAVDAVSFVVSAVFLLAMRVQKSPRSERQP